jgi:hypothetical protein
MEQFEAMKRMRVIRRLASPVPAVTALERLAKIEGIASGKLDHMSERPKSSPDLMERLHRGQASRSPRNAADTAKAEAERRKREDAEKKAEDADKKRGRRGGRDREERGGFDRSEG